MVASGIVNRIGRGLYATDEALANSMYDVRKLIPGGIVCSYTAWSYYGLTTRIPITFCIAVARGRKVTLPDYPLITLYHQSEQQLRIGKNKCRNKWNGNRHSYLDRIFCNKKRMMPS